VIVLGAVVLSVYGPHAESEVFFVFFLVHSHLFFFYDEILGVSVLFKGLQRVIIVFYVA